MLVLTRRAGESIMIGDDIEVKIVQIRGSGDTAQVRIGIFAPRGIPVLRNEIYGQVKEENLRAARQARASHPRQVAEMLGSVRKHKTSPVLVRDNVEDGS